MARLQFPTQFRAILRICDFCGSKNRIVVGIIDLDDNKRHNCCEVCFSNMAEVR